MFYWFSLTELLSHKFSYLNWSGRKFATTKQSWLF